MADSKKILEILITAKDKSAQALHGLSANLENASGASKRFALALGAVGVGVGILGKKMLDSAIDYEQTTIAFETMLGSAEKAQNLLGDLADFASRTPFELKGIEGTAKSLLAFGISADELIPTLKSLGDVSAGLSVPIEQIAGAYGKVKVQGKLTGMTLLQFTRSGIPLIQELADKFDVTKDKITDMTARGEIGFKDVEEAFQNMSNEGGKFANLMDKQSASLGGMISNLADAWDLFLRGEGASMLDWGKKIVQWVIGLVENTLPAFIVSIKNLADYLKENSTALYIVGGAIMGALVPAIWSAVVAFGAFAVAIAPFLIGGAIVGALVAGIMWIVKHWDVIKEKTSQVWGAITEKLTGAFNTITNAVTSTFNFIGNFFKSYFELVFGIFNYGVSLITGALHAFLNWLFPSFDEKFLALVEYLTAFWEKVWGVFSTGLGIVINLWREQWEILKTIGITIFNSIGEGLLNFWNFVKGVLDTVAEPIKNAWSAIWDGVKEKTTGAWDGIKNIIKTSINWIIDKINWFVKKANKLASKGNVIPGVTVPQFGTIPRLAKGGIVDSPTLAMIGEAGREAVIPLDRNLDLGGGTNITLNITGNQLMNERDAEKLGDKIIQKLKYNLAF